LSGTELRTLLSLALGGIIEIQNSDFVTQYFARLALLRDEVRILIFDNPAENERGQRPFLEDLGG
jgi:hypothetical protein